VTACSKPTKKPTSFHSIFTTLTSGILLALFFALFSPKANAALGLFQILDVQYPAIPVYFS
jgi:hypothetical protein